MEEKECIRCEVPKPLSEFPQGAGCKDGTRNQCKKCCAVLALARYHEKKKDPEWFANHRARTKEYNQKNPHRNRAHVRKYAKENPEKLEAKFAVASSKQHPSRQGYNWHHWSYRREHWLDVISLKVGSHRIAHTYLKYDTEEKMYRTVEGELLDSREKHEAYISKILK